MSLKLNEQVGGYTVVEQLGQGGMATVYKAYHPRLERYVAIKVMHQTFLEDQTFRTRFTREAQIVARLEHPHIVPVYDFDEHEGQPYLVMKLIQGETLKERLLRGPLSLEEIDHVMTAVGSALNYAHEQDVLHRDIKPSNIVIDEDNTPYLTDFGLARIAKAGESTMSADMLLGTPQYISPEQARGLKELDGRTDLYSLGVVLYELVVGRVPFSADTPYSIIHDHIYTPLPLPSVVNPEIPMDVEEVLLRALAKDPADRYSSANELVTAFRRAIHTSELEVLSADRVSVASASLAQIREEQQAQSMLAGTPVPDAVPVPTASNADLSTGAVYKSRGNSRAWIMGGIASFSAISLLFIFVLLSAMDNIFRIAELSAGSDNQPTIIRPDPVSYLYDVPPDLSVESARNFLNDNPDNAAAYLGLANAYLLTDNGETQAVSTLQEGAQVVEDLPRFFLTAAELADSHDNELVAISLAFVAFNEAMNDSDATARALAGEFLYAKAQTIDIEALDLLRTLNRVTGSTQAATAVTESTIFKVFSATSHLANDRALLAQRAINNIASGEENLPEVRLVQAEIYLTQDDNLVRAAPALGLANQAQDTPAWVRFRALELLDTIGEN